jgi:hypothetical protein
MSLVIFGIHLILLVYLIYRSGYIPKIIGILLVIDGLGWVIDSLQAYLYPNAHLETGPAPSNQRAILNHPFRLLLLTFPGGLSPCISSTTCANS